MCRRQCEVGLNVQGCENGKFLPVRTSCYECGGPACKACSAIITTKSLGRSIRIRRCNGCAGFYQDAQGNDIRKTAV